MKQKIKVTRYFYLVNDILTGKDYSLSSDFRFSIGSTVNKRINRKLVKCIVIGITGQSIPL